MTVDLAWPFHPEDTPVETLEWMTNVHPCKKAEYRRCMRPVPRTTYKYTYLLNAADYSSARERSRVLAGLTSFLVPDWPNAVRIPSISAGTASLPVDAIYIPALRTNAYVLITSSNNDYEVVQISAVGTGTVTVEATARSHTTPWIVPTRLGTFAQAFSGGRGPQDYTEATAVFEITDGEDLFGASGGRSYPTYLGDPLVTDSVEIINAVSETDQRDVEVLDSRTGSIFKYKTQETPNHTGVLGWTALDASELWSLRVWLHSRRGKWKRFWASSWNADFVVTKDIVPGDSAVQIAEIGFTDKYPLPTDIVIANAALGSFVGIRVDSVTTTMDGNELLHFSGSWSGSTWSAEDLIISKLTLSRFDSDRIEIQHLPGRQATVAVGIKEVPVYP